MEMFEVVQAPLGEIRLTGMQKNVQKAEMRERSPSRRELSAHGLDCPPLLVPPPCSCYHNELLAYQSASEAQPRMGQKLLHQMVIPTGLRHQD
eukprot:scaffold249299_cov19-Tisochrysis_lutea.AAC.1